MLKERVFVRSAETKSRGAAGWWYGYDCALDSTQWSIDSVSWSRTSERKRRRENKLKRERERYSGWRRRQCGAGRGAGGSALLRWYARSGARRGTGLCSAQAEVDGQERFNLLSLSTSSLVRSFAAFHARPTNTPRTKIGNAAVFSPQSTPSLLHPLSLSSLPRERSVQRRPERSATRPPRQWWSTRRVTSRRCFVTLDPETLRQVG